MVTPLTLCFGKTGNQKVWPMMKTAFLWAKMKLGEEEIVARKRNLFVQLRKVSTHTYFQLPQVWHCDQKLQKMCSLQELSIYLWCFLFSLIYHLFVLINFWVARNRLKWNTQDYWPLACTSHAATVPRSPFWWWAIGFCVNAASPKMCTSLNNPQWHWPPVWRSNIILMMTSGELGQ